MTTCKTEDVLEKLRHAHGQSRHVLAIFIDIRAFSSFAGVGDSTDVAIYLRGFYSRTLEHYFPTVNYVKLTGDGLMLIRELAPTTQAVQESCREAVSASLRLIDDFPQIASEDLMVNFDVPRQLGIGIARGSATVLIAEDRTTLDYTGRCLNLAARLMDLARPEGLVFHDAHGEALLGADIMKHLTVDEAYIRGIADRTPLPVLASEKVKMPASARLPRDARTEYGRPRIVKVETLERIDAACLVNMKQRTINAETVRVHVEFKLEQLGGTLSIARPAGVIESPDGMRARLSPDQVVGICKQMRDRGVADGTDVKLTSAYDV